MGIYETYSGTVVATVDARGERCDQVDHVLHRVVPLPEGAGPGTPENRAKSGPRSRS